MPDSPSPPSAEHWRLIEQSFAAASELSGEERQGYLERLWREHPDVHAEVASLLDIHSRAGSRLEDSALAHLAPLPPAHDGEDASHPSDGSMAGRRIGPWAIVRMIERGGMGSVFLAERADDHYHQQVAIKLIHPSLLGGWGLADRDELLMRFHTERQVLANLTHPNIARLLDGGTTDDGIPYLVMEYVDGVRIDEWCDAHRLTLRQRIALFRDVCAAVQHAHQNLVIHRDIKPGNILVTGSPDSPVVKLLDFGIAKVLDHSTANTAGATVTVQRRLTPAYASPEQVRGETVTTASDVYALGVVLYELLTGRTPYRLRPQTDAALQRAVCDQPPTRPGEALARSDAGAEAIADAGDTDTRDTRPRTTHDIATCRGADPAVLRRQLRGDLETILLTALAKEPSRRYAAAQQLADDLQRWADGLPIAAHPPSTLYHLSRFIRRNRILTGAVAAVCVALVAAALIASAGLLHARAAAAEAQRQMRIAEAANRFLNEQLLGAASPERFAQLPAQDITVRVLLDLAADELEAEAADNADVSTEDAGVQAAVRLTIGRTYRTLGEYDAALPHLEEALRLHTLIYGERHPLTLRAMDQLAVLHALSARYDEAQHLQNRAVELSWIINGPQHTDTVRFTDHLASLLADRGELDEALRLRTELVEISRRSRGTADYDTLSFMIGLGHLYQESDKLDQAEAILAEALQHCREKYASGRDGAHSTHPLTLRAMNNLAIVYDRQRRHEDSYPLHREALAAKKSLLGPDHPSTLTSLHNLGLLLLNLERFEEAQPLLHQTVERSTQRLGPDHPDTIESLNTLGFLYLQWRRLDEAEPILLDALERLTQARGEEDRATAGAMHNVARLYLLSERFDAAEDMFARLADVLARMLPPEHPAIANVLADRGFCLLRLNRPDEARPILLDAHARLQTALGPDHPRTRRVEPWLEELEEPGQEH